MILEGRLFKDGKFWLAEIAALDALTQGRSKSHALKMLKDLVATMAEDRNLNIRIFTEGKERLLIESDGHAEILALILRRQRAKHGLSVRDLAKRMGFKSHNAYSQYERGKTEASLSQVERVLAAIDPKGKITLKVS